MVDWITEQDNRLGQAPRGGGIPSAWRYQIIWEYLPSLQKWGVRIAHMSWADLSCNATPQTTVVQLDPRFFEVPTYKLYDEFSFWNGKWESCHVDALRNW